MTPSQQLEALLREACPETKELKFGCAVVSNDRYYGEGHRWVVTKISNNVECVDECGDEASFDEICLTIIGSPLTLEHVLRAIAKCGFCRWAMQILTDGRIVVAHSNFDNLLKSGFTYDLTKSPLDQSPETTAFLVELLKP